MKSITFVLVLCFSLMLSGCVPSINPFYSNADVYFDIKLLGEWVEKEGSESWTFEPGSDNDYKLTYTDEGKKTGTFTAKLFKLADRTFLDITPLRSDTGQNDFYNGHLLPLHTFVQITMDGKSGHIAYLDPAWLKRMLEKHPNAIQHAVWSDDDIFLIDSTKNLQKFLIANLNTPDAYERSAELKRKAILKKRNGSM